MTTRDLLREYLRDIHALEEQSLEQLRSAPEIAGEPALATAHRDHLAETQRHERIVRELLEKRNGGHSVVKDAIMRVWGEGFVMFARSQPDTPGKLATHALSYEALEWAAYDLLEQLALRVGDAATVEMVDRILQEERRAAESFRQCLEETVSVAVAG